ncbi:MAG TPA: hypothetical protein VM848_11920 [Acidimicrobiia bacterium]|nr:hypothetical protein [Acidimicrobiia bacterium]
MAVETIYRGFEGKSGLFQAVVEAAVAGGADRAERPVEERPAIKAVIEEPDPRRKVELYAATQPGIHARSGALLRALREAATVAPELAAVLQRLESQRLEGMARLAQHLADHNFLRAGITVEQARDLLWAVNSLTIHDLLVLERGWLPDRYQWWITTVMTNSLLSGPPIGDTHE